MSVFAVVPTIPEYFTGKNVFVTGGTGFLGKALLEKLLRSCPNIGNIYVLVRAKKDVPAQERLRKIIELPFFETLRGQQPKAAEKLVAVTGDVTQLGLGLSDSDRKTLIENTHIVVHAAASIRFDDPLTDAILMNTRGTREVANLVLEMKKICVFVHVSTTYCNTDRRIIEEKLYPPHADWKEAIKMAEQADRHTVDILTAKYMGSLPNTYTFTKSLAEHVVHDLCGGKVPTVVFRPSIVISTIAEPVKGWIDNFNGPVGLLVASGKGIIKTAYASPDVIADYMPVDVAIKAMITAIWTKGRKMSIQEKQRVKFYNCSSYNRQHLTMGEMVETGHKLTWEVPLENQIWFPFGGITSSKLVYYLVVIFLHVVPALFFDSLLYLAGKKTMLVKIQRRIYIANLAVAYFLTNQWSFLNDELLQLEENLLDADKADFGYVVENVDVYEYFRQAMIGGKRYLLNEDMSEEGIQKAKKHMKRMWVLHCLSLLFLFAVIAWFTMTVLYSRVFTFLL